MSSEKASIVDRVLPKTTATIRAASGLASNDIKFYKSLDQEVSQSSERASNRLLSLINQITNSIESVDEEEITKDTLTESWKTVSNVLDALLEKSDLAFDGLRNQKNPNNEAKNNLTYINDSNSLNSNNDLRKRIEKPQKYFKKQVDNSESHPFRPLLTSKPNSIISLKDSLVLTDADENNPSHYPHPYENEILNQEYNSAILEKSEPINPTDWESTEPIWVSTVDDLNLMLKDLRSCTEIAIDLEHHDYRSYYGIVCLMQISSREKDWLVDTLSLREELQVLNEVFTNPNITKVLHGAFMDIIWLQRDFGLYIVSLFDTYHASKQLGFPKHGLAYLLERFAHFKTSKKYQLADWRIRPLTPPMKLYARADTHFLLYIYDLLKNMLIESDKLNVVLFNSREVAKRRFEYTSFRPKLASKDEVYSLVEKDEPWKSLLYQYNLPASKTGIVKALYDWREQSAKNEDESPRYIMPNQLLVSLTSAAPTDAAGVLASSSMITEYVRKNSKTVSEIISAALKDGGNEDLNSYDQQNKNNTETEVTVENVSKLQELYTLINTKEQLTPKNFSKKSILFTKQMFKPSKTLEFTDGKLISNKLDRTTRFKEIRDALDTFVAIELEEITQKQTGEIKETPPEVNTIIPEAEEGPIKQDPDEIIVLKKKQQHKFIKTKKSHDEAQEATDYSKFDKLINNDTKARKQKKRPVSKFDPYAQESEGPKPAKRQFNPSTGKSSSFRK